MKVILRPALPEDEDFLYELFSAVRIDELAAWNWDPAQREVLLKIQFRAQRQQYLTQFQYADQQIIQLNNLPIGQVIINRAEHELQVIDIALLSKYHGKGIGTGVLEGLLAEAQREGKTFRLQVLKTNRALRLYERLGLSIVSDSGSHYLMEKGPLLKVAVRRHGNQE